MAAKNEVRMGVIGYGNIGHLHTSYYPKLARLRLTAICDNDPKALAKAKKDFPNIKHFASHTELLDSGEVDAIVIGTPHYFHVPIAIDAFKRGIHVISEKPVAVTGLAAEEAIKAHKKYPKVIYAAMFNQRTSPAYRKVRELVKSGEIGEIQRTNWIITSWFRTQAYYNSGGWRATWGGEGGGVLLNQCPHNLDLWQWICGMPSRITAYIGIGKYHKIEVEDEVTAYAEYPNGATGLFITSTGEAPGTNRLEITGTRGKIISDGGKTIELLKNTEDARKFSDTTSKSFASPGRHKYTIEVESDGPQHQLITENFVAAVLDGKPLIAPAEEGIHGVELANAMIMSGLTKKPVDIPTNRKAYDAFLKKLVKGSKLTKTVKDAVVDMSASYH